MRNTARTTGRPLGRVTSLLATGALTVGTLAVGSLALTPTAAAMPAPTDPTPVALSAQWMVGNLNSAGLVEIFSEWGGITTSSASYGTSIDLANSLKQVGGRDADAKRITDAVAAALPSYIGSGTELYSGSAAKALALTVDQGRDPLTFGGVNLKEKVESTVATAAPITGRLQDSSTWGDYANSIGQAFAAKSLTKLQSSRATEVTSYLLDQQCSAGFFRLYFADKAAVDQSCDGAVPAESTNQSSDTTAIVVQQLAPLASGNAEIRTAVEKAVTWLKTQQKSDGSFHDPSYGANTNTTGLAGNALRLAGDEAAAARAAVWLRARQVVGVCETKLAAETGAVAYDDNGLREARVHGITDPLDRTQWILADAQALPALLAAPANPARDAVTLPKFVKAGSATSFTVAGLAAGERACLTGAVAQDLVGTGGVLTGRIPAATKGAQTVTLRTATGTATGATTGLAKKKLKVKAKKSVKRGAKVKVTVRGLAAGETVTIRLAKKKVTGTAKANGTFKKSLKAPKKRGTVKVAVSGQFKNRSGTSKLRVR